MGLLSIPLLTACPAPNPPAGGPAKVVCNDDAETEYCWKETFCASSAATICAVGLNGDINQAGLYPNAVFSGTCNPTSPEHPIPPCVCEYLSEDGSICDEDSGSSSEGDPPTGGPSLDQYICTIHSQIKCVDYNYEESPLIDPFEECWVAPSYPDTYQPCVLAEDGTNAREQCEALCNTHKTDVEADIAAFNAANPGEILEVVGDPIDCTLDDSPSGDEPAILDYPYICAAQSQALLAWGGVTELQPFSSMAGLVLSGGGSTSNSDIIGYVGFEVSGCGGGTCDVTIDAFEVRRTDLAGTVWGFAGPLASYEVEAFDMHLIQVVHGTITQSTGIITFPSEPFIGVLTADDYSIDSTPIGPWETMQYVTQVTGALDASDVLTLNFTLNMDGGVVTMTIETYE